MNTIKRWLQSLSPAYRRSIEKRRLESILKSHGVSRKDASSITNQFWNEK
jgi:hypothetical protein